MVAPTAIQNMDVNKMSSSGKVTIDLQDIELPNGQFDNEFLDRLLDLGISVALKDSSVSS